MNKDRFGMMKPIKNDKKCVRTCKCTLHFVGRCKDQFMAMAMSQAIFIRWKKLNSMVLAASRHSKSPRGMNSVTNCARDVLRNEANVKTKGQQYCTIKLSPVVDAPMNCTTASHWEHSERTRNLVASTRGEYISRKWCSPTFWVPQLFHNSNFLSEIRKFWGGQVICTAHNVGSAELPFSAVYQLDATTYATAK